MGWLIYFGVILAASLVLGWHLGRFRNACTEMTGMMAGMTIGMLGGFALGYGISAAVGRDIFIGNLVGVILGAVLGGWFGRAGDLMGIMDGAMGGVMGGSMGAMIASMIYVDWKLQWTGVLFGSVYVIGALALTALIESRAPDHQHLHWLLPKLLRARRSQPVRTAAALSRSTTSTVPLRQSAVAPVRATSTVVTTAYGPTPVPAARSLRDYYALLRIEKSADLETIEGAYLNLLATADEDTSRRVDRAFTTLRDPKRRARYDAALQERRKAEGQPHARPALRTVAATAPVSAAGSERGDCCPPPRKKAQPADPASVAAGTSQAARPVTHAGAAVAVAASVAANATQTTGKNKARTLAPAPLVPTPARQAGQLPSLKSANAAFASAHTGNGHTGGKSKGHTNGFSNTRNQKSGKQAAQGLAQHGAQQKNRKGTPASREAYYGSEDYAYRQSRGWGRRYEYVEPDNGVGKRIAMGAGLGAAAMLLVFWMAFGAAGGASGAGSDQTVQGSYDNPVGAVYHAPGAVPSAAQLEGQAVAATLGADGTQTAILTLDERTSSYSPAAIKVKKGVPVKLNLTTNGGGRDCRSVVDIPTLGARGFIESGAGTMELTPAQEGVYEFNCPMRMVSPSYLVVTN